MTELVVKTVRSFERKLSNLKSRDSQLFLVIINTIEEISFNPFKYALKTHKVVSKDFGMRYASSMNGDWRIIWDFEDDRKGIILLSLNRHSGGGKVYK